MSRIRSSHEAPATKRATDWRDSAACRGEASDIFFASPLTGAGARDVEHAKAICQRCPSVDACLQWALETGEDNGIWGGLSEDERRTLKRRPARPINIDTYAGTRPQRQKATTLLDAWEMYTQAEGEHVLWTGPKVLNIPGTKTQVTANRLAFYLDRGHWPEGDTKRTCEVNKCVRPAHLADRTERAEEADLIVSPNGRRLAPCGTRSAYLRHRKNGEKACDACRRANSDADNRLRRTGTTKALV